MHSRPEFSAKSGAKAGKLVVSKAAKTLGINQPSLKRMLDGQSGRPSEENAQKLMRYFGVTFEQLIGNHPIDWLDGDDSGEPDRAYLLNELRTLAFKHDEDFMQEVIKYARFLDSQQST